MYTIKKHAGEGSRSSFYKLNQRGKGFKTFVDREDAEYAHAIQSELSLDDLAPKVYSEVGRIRIGNRLSPWGYITEVAKTITPHGVSCECSRCEDIEDKYSEEIAELQDYGITRIYHPDDGRAMGLQGMINDLVEKCDFPTGKTLSYSIEDIASKKDACLAQVISAAENFPEDHAALS